MDQRYDLLSKALYYRADQVLSKRHLFPRSMLYAPYHGYAHLISRQYEMSVPRTQFQFTGEDLHKISDICMRLKKRAEQFYCAQAFYHATAHLVRNETKPSEVEDWKDRCYKNNFAAACYYQRSNVPVRLFHGRPSQPLAPYKRMCNSITEREERIACFFGTAPGWLVTRSSSSDGSALLQRACFTEPLPKDHQSKLACMYGFLIEWLHNGMQVHPPYKGSDPCADLPSDFKKECDFTLTQTEHWYDMLYTYPETLYQNTTVQNIRKTSGLWLHDGAQPIWTKPDPNFSFPYPKHPTLQM